MTVLSLCSVLKEPKRHTALSKRCLCRSDCSNNRTLMTEAKLVVDLLVFLFLKVFQEAEVLSGMTMSGMRCIKEQ